MAATDEVDNEKELASLGQARLLARLLTHFGEVGSQLSEGWVRVTDSAFGAVGDGETDDTEAIQAAFDTGKHVFFPASSGEAQRTYRITAPIVQRKVGQIIQGEGMNRVRILQATNGENAINIRESSEAALPQYPDGGYVQWPVIRDLRIEAANAGTGTGIDVTSDNLVGGAGGDYVTIENVNVYNFATGIKFTGVGQSKVRDCLINYCTTGIETSGSFQNSHQFTGTAIVRGSIGLKYNGNGGVFMLGDLGNNDTYEIECVGSGTFIGGNVESYGTGSIGTGRVFRLNGGMATVMGMRILAASGETNEPFLVEANSSLLVQQCVATQLAAGTAFVRSTGPTACAWIQRVPVGNTTSVPEGFQIHRSDVGVKFRSVPGFQPVMDNEVVAAAAGLRGMGIQVINRTTGRDYLAVCVQTGSGTFEWTRLDAFGVTGVANTWSANQNFGTTTLTVGPASGGTGGTYRYSAGSGGARRDYDLRWDRYAFGDMCIRIGASTGSDPTIPRWYHDGANNRTHVGHNADSAPSGSATFNVHGSVYASGDWVADKTITPGGTTGAQTINKNAGSVNFAAGATSLEVTNSRVTVNSVIVATVATDDATMKSVVAVAGSGSFTLYANAAATAETRVNWWIVN